MSCGSRNRYDNGSPTAYNQYSFENAKKLFNISTI